MANDKKQNTDHQNISSQVDENPQHLVISSTNIRSDYQNGNNEAGEIYNDDIIYQYNLDDWQG